MTETVVTGGDLVLDAKLIAPAQRLTWIDRPGLLDELEGDQRLTLVSAPAGSGKSTLLAQWVAARVGRDLAWLRLDEGDNTPVVFWTYVVSALTTVRPSFGATLLRRLRAPGVDVADEVLPLLTNELFELEPVTLVLDDLQTITDDEVYEGLAYVIERLPQRTRIVSATQVDPPLPLSRLRAHGDLHEIRDLRFSADETNALLGAVLGFELSLDDTGRVHERTEGWAAGVQLAGLSARGNDDPVAFLNELPAHRYAVDFLWDEVLAHLEPDLRRFVAEISILDSFSAELCVAVTTRVDAERPLCELERLNVFLEPLDATRDWYRFHQVFRSALDRELAELAPHEVADLHRRASEWYAEHGLVFEAIDHAVVAGDMNYAADQLVANWPLPQSEGREHRVLAWLDRLPPELVASDPSVCLLASLLARFLGRRDDAERWLALLDTDVALRPELFPVFGESPTEAVAIIRSMLALARGDIDEALAEARRADAAVTDEHAIGKVVASYFLGIVLFFADDSEAAQPLLDRVLTDPLTVDQQGRRFFAGALSAYIALDRGDVDNGLRLAREALARANECGLEEYSQTAHPHGALGAALLASGDLDGAEEHLEQAVALVRRSGDGSDVALTLLQLGRLRLRQGDHEAAHDALAASRSALEVAGLPRIARLDRELARALRSARRKSTAAPADELTEAELRVLRMLPYDLTYREIAGRLFISMNTLKTHTQRIRRKLGVASRSETVASARRRGLL